MKKRVRLQNRFFIIIISSLIKQRSVDLGSFLTIIKKGLAFASQHFTNVIMGPPDYSEFRTT